MHNVFLLTLMISFLVTSCFSDSNTSMEESHGEETQSADDYGLTEAEQWKEYNLDKLAEIEATLDQEIYNIYIDNDLLTGSMPYESCYGSNSSCSSSACSKVSVRASNSSDVIVTLKQGGEVVRHAYIQRGQEYTFSVPNGTYQPFFYYGKGWNPEKAMPSSSCSSMKGGFVSAESVGKDDPQRLSNHILSYELVEQVNGNFETRPSNKNEAF